MNHKILNVRNMAEFQFKHWASGLLFLALVHFCGFANAQRNLKDIPDSDPDVELKSFIVADGFEVNLYASDPLLAKPIQMNFDAKGRLWVASSEVYPHIKPGQKPTDKIIVLEDKNGDGVSDKSTVFADGLLIPTGVLPGNGGCYAVNSTELLYFADTDGDEKADFRRVVLSGFGTEDTHHLLHTLRWGHDGMMYMNQSIYIHSHVETPYGVKRLNAGGIWQFRPETMELDVLCRGLVNPWGHHFDKWGQSFATDGAGGEGINYVFPGSVSFTAYQAKRILKGLNPGSPKLCGLEIASGSHLPDNWQGNIITNDFRANRVCRYVITEDGSGYSSRQEVEVIKTKHMAFRPIDVKMGPDGAIYIADWYNPIIQHGEVDFRDPRRDHVHGRIWRVTAKGRKTVPRQDLTTLSTEQLLDKLKVNEEWVRLHAKLQLKRRLLSDTLPKVSKWVASLDSSDPNFEHNRLEGLWAYQSLNQANEDLMNQCLNSSDHRVRAAAVRAISVQRKLYSNSDESVMSMVNDSHPRVRLEAVRALSKVKTAQAAQLALTVLDKPMDRFLDFALWQCMRDLQEAWLPKLENGTLDFDGNIKHLSFALKSIDSPAVSAPLVKMIRAGKVPADRLDNVMEILIGLGGPKDLDLVFEKILKDSSLSEDSKSSLLSSLSSAAVSRGAKPTKGLDQVLGWVKSSNSKLKISAIEAIGNWKLESGRELLEQIATNQNETTPAKHNAIYSIGKLGGPKSIAVLSKIIKSSPFDEKIAATNSTVQFNVNQAAKFASELLVQHGRQSKVIEGQGPANIISNLLAQKNGQAALRKSLGNIDLGSDTARLAIRAVRSAPKPDNGLIEQLQKSGKLDGKSWKATPELVQKLVGLVGQSGDASRGELVYRRNELQCLNCHAIGGSGGKVGPDLLSVGASAPVDYLVQSLLDPNSKVKENYHSKIIETIDGKQISGIPIRRDDNSVTLRNEKDEEIEVRIEDIDAESDGRSLMPDGTVDSLTEAELVDLVAFLSQLGKIGKFAVGNQRAARSWESLVWTAEGHRRLNRTSYDTAATDDPAFTWKKEYSLVSGELPFEPCAPFLVHRRQSPTSFVRCKVSVTTAGKVGFKFENAEGLQVWVDGKPTPVDQLKSVQLGSGIHTITLAVNRDQRKSPIYLELVDVKGSGAKAQMVVGK